MQDLVHRLLCISDPVMLWHNAKEVLKFRKRAPLDPEVVAVLKDPSQPTVWDEDNTLWDSLAMPVDDGAHDDNLEEDAGNIKTPKDANTIKRGGKYHRIKRRKNPNPWTDSDSESSDSVGEDEPKRKARKRGPGIEIDD